MYCPKCGAENTDQNQICENCGCRFAVGESKEILPSLGAVNTASKEVTAETPLPLKFVKTPALPDLNKHLPNLFFAVAFSVLVLSVIGAVCLFIGGARISEIQSVGGKTLEEAYYSRLQLIYNGFGFLVLSAGIFMSATLSFFGFSIKKESQKQDVTDAVRLEETKTPAEI